MVRDGIIGHPFVAGVVQSRHSSQRDSPNLWSNISESNARLRNIEVRETLFSADHSARVQQLDVPLSHAHETKVQLNDMAMTSARSLELVLPKASERGQLATLRYIVDDDGDLYITEKYLKSAWISSEDNNPGADCADGRIVTPSAQCKPPIANASDASADQQTVKLLSNVLNQLRQGPQGQAQTQTQTQTQTQAQAHDVSAERGKLLGLVEQMSELQQRINGINTAQLNLLLPDHLHALVGEAHGRPSGALKGLVARLLGRFKTSVSQPVLTAPHFGSPRMRANLLLAHRAFNQSHGANANRRDGLSATGESAHAFAAQFLAWPGAAEAVVDALNTLDAAGVMARLAVLAVTPYVGSENVGGENASASTAFEMRLRGKLATALSLLRTQNPQEKSLMSLEYDALIVSFSEQLAAYERPQSP